MVMGRAGRRCCQAGAAWLGAGVRWRWRSSSSAIGPRSRWRLVRDDAHQLLLHVGAVAGAVAVPALAVDDGEADRLLGAPVWSPRRRGVVSAASRGHGCLRDDPVRDAPARYNRCAAIAIAARSIALDHAYANIRIDHSLRRAARAAVTGKTEQRQVARKTVRSRESTGQQRNSPVEDTPQAATPRRARSPDRGRGP